MATSETRAFTLDLTDAIEEAWERATGDELRTGYELRTARRSLNLLFMEWQNRGLHFWTLQENSQVLATGQESFDLPTPFIDVLDALVRANEDTEGQQDRMLTRVSINSFTRITNKLQRGAPTRYYIEKLDTPKMYVWPVPEVEYTIKYWTIRYIQDAVEGRQTQDVPVRYLPALVAGLAFYIAQKVPDAFSRLEGLKLAYEEQFGFAEAQEREKASWKIVPAVRR